MDTYGAVQVDRIVGTWRKRMVSPDPQISGAIRDDPCQAAYLEHIRRTCHMYEEAMRLEDIPESTRERVLSMVLLGDPSGLENLAALRNEQLLKTAMQYLTPSPIFLPADLPPFGRVK